MPLRKGYSKEVISANIRELTRANRKRKKKRSQRQIVAIALSTARLHAMRAGKKVSWLHKPKTVKHRRRAR